MTNRAASFFLTLPLMAQGPIEDSRLKAIEGTDYTYRMPEYRTRAEWEAHKTHLGKQILAAAGLFPMPELAPLNAQIFGRLERDGYSVEKVYLETLPGYYLCGNLYKPRGRAGKFPGVVSPHGHWKTGRLENAELGSVPGRAISLARQGYVVFSYDMVGYNDTSQTPHVFGERREQLYNFGPLGLQLWNSIRALDFVESLPEVDRERLAATGASGGGTQTFLLYAVDDRVKAAAPVNMISGIMQGGSPCENAPGLRHDTFNVEFGAMLAPRPLLMVSATGDWTKNTPQSEFPAIQRIYALYDAAANVETVQFDSQHNYHQGSREAMYTFFAKRLLGGDGAPVREEPFTVEKNEDLLVWANRKPPGNALDYQGVFAQWREWTRVRGVNREALRYALSAETPSKVAHQQSGELIALYRPGRGDRVTGLYRKGSGTPVLVVHPDGAEAGRTAEQAAGRTALWIDAFRGGRNETARHFLTFHRTDDQNRVRDILTALAWLNGPAELRCIGRAAVWCTFAAAVHEGELKLRAPVSGFQATDDDFLNGFFVPGIQRVGGWQAALKLTEKQRQ
ncbi:MAG: acetylxylan esterase [Acidobacteria bacterium]|nr:acetylxylan esterase [Acidobacteriota bacterium]